MELFKLQPLGARQIAKMQLGRADFTARTGAAPAIFSGGHPIEAAACAI